MLFLVYAIPNGGVAATHYHDCLPSRIMLLPVEMELAISRLLFIRLAMTFVANLLLILVNNLFFLNGVPWILVLILPSLFLIRQAWNWLYSSRITLAGYTGVLVAAMVAVSLIVSLIPFEALSNPLVTWSIATSILAGIGLWTYKISVFAAKRFRCNRYPALPFHIPGRRKPRDGGAVAPISFRSPRTANLWAYSRRKGLSLPVATLGVALLGMFLYVIFDLTYVSEPSPPESYYGGQRLHLTLLRVWGPWYALLCATMLTGLLPGGSALETGRMCASTERFFPLSASAITANRIFGNGLSLAVTWFIVALVAASPFLFGQGALGWRIYSEAWQAGEVSAREIARSELGLPLLMLLAAWVLLAIRTRLVLYTAGLAILPVAVEAISQFQMYDFRNVDFEQYIRYQLHLDRTLSFAAVVLIVVPYAALSWAAWRGAAPLRHVTACGVVWLSVVLFSYPYQQWPVGSPTFTTIALAMVMGSLAILPYPALLIDIHRSRHGSDSLLSQCDRRATSRWNLPPRVRVLSATLLATLLFLACWISWPSKPAYVDTLRGQGKPATLPDVAESVPKVAHGARPAGELLGLLRQTGKAESEALKRLSDGEYIGNDQYMISSSGLRKFDDSSSLRRGPLPTTTWDALTARNNFFTLQTASTKQLAVKYGRLSGPVSHLLDYELFENAFDIFPLMKSPEYFNREFPLSTLEEDWYVTNHSYEMEQLANGLALEIWVASVEDNRADLFRALEFSGILARTLQEEPTIASQISYLYLYTSTVQAIGFSMNRIKFTDEELQSLVRWSDDVLPAGATQKAVDLAVAHEITFEMDRELHAARTGNALTGPAAYAESWSGGYYRAAGMRLYAHIGRSSNATSAPLLWDEIRTSILPRFEAVASTAFRSEEYNKVLIDIQIKTSCLTMACALERYRLTNGKLPDRLEQLVPDYLAQIDEDPYRSGQAISYRIRDDGEFVLYSYGPDVEDDWEDQKESNDITFSVAPPDVRNGPRFAESPPRKEGA